MDRQRCMLLRTNVPAAMVSGPLALFHFLYSQQCLVLTNRLAGFILRPLACYTGCMSEASDVVHVRGSDFCCSFLGGGLATHNSFSTVHLTSCSRLPYSYA